jgi:Ca2+-transporting ATPase
MYTTLLWAMSCYLSPATLFPVMEYSSSHNVQVDESSARGESYAIKKLSYQECIALRDRCLEEFDTGSPVGDGESTNGLQKNNVSGLDLLGHTDCFMVSRSR